MICRTTPFHPDRNIIMSAMSSQPSLHVSSFMLVAVFNMAQSSLCYCWVRLNANAASSFTKSIPSEFLVTTFPGRRTQSKQQCYPLPLQNTLQLRVHWKKNNNPGISQRAVRNCKHHTKLDLQFSHRQLLDEEWLQQNLHHYTCMKPTD